MYYNNKNYNKQKYLQNFRECERMISYIVSTNAYTYVQKLRMLEQQASFLTHFNFNKLDTEYLKRYINMNIVLLELEMSDAS